MSSTRERRAWAAGAALAVLSGSLALERRHLRRIATDPEGAALRDPPHGRVLEARSADGTTLHVEVFGDAAGDEPTIVLGHGWTETIAFWIYVIRALCHRGLRVVAYDLRGHGQSEPASGDDYSIARFGEDLEAVLVACLAEGQRAVLVGHSLGAMAIAAWAEHHDVGRRAAGAALLNTGVGDLLTENLLVPVPWIAQLLNRIVPPTTFVGSRAPIPRFSTPLGHAAVRYVAFGPVASPAQVAFYERMLVGCPPDARANVGIALSELELYHALANLTVPTVVLAGANDRLTPPSHAERIGELLPDLRRLVVLAETGHMAPLERPREVSELLGELAAEVMSGARTAAA